MAADPQSPGSLPSRRAGRAQAGRRLTGQVQTLESKVAEQMRQLGTSRAEALRRLALAAEYREDATSQHTERVGATSAAIAAQLGLGRAELALPDAILLRPGKLTVEEYELVKTHAELGARLLSGSSCSSPVLQMAAVIAASHHERWDGNGYPEGLAGEEIPLVGRVVAVADVYDALTHDRPYKSLWPVEQAIAEIRRASASQFDPRVVEAFLAMHEEAAHTDEADLPPRRALFGSAPVRRRGSSVSRPAGTAPRA
jgi:putative two-component system response regulator